MKKMVSLLLALMMLMSLTGGALAETAEKPTLTIMTPDYGFYKPYNEMKLYQDYEEATGVHIDWMMVPEAEFGEKLSLVLATGDNMPDIIFGGLNESLVNNNVESGNFIAFDELIDNGYMPNLSKIFEQRPTLRTLWSNPDGKLYQLGRVEEMFGLIFVHGCHFINKVWLDKFDLEVPTTTEEYYNALKTFVENDANGNGIRDEIGLTFLDQPTNPWRNHSGFGSLWGSFGMPDTGDHIYVKDGKVLYTANTESYKEGIAYFAKMYEEGLIDSEVFNQNEAQMVAKGTMDENVFGSFMKWHSTHAVGVERAKDYVPLPPLKGPDGHQEWSRENLTELGGTQYYCVITKACEDPELAARWLDHGFDPLVSIQVNWGAIGEVYEYNDAGILVNKKPPEGMDDNDLRISSTPTKNPHAILSDYYDKYVIYPYDAAEMYAIREEYYFDYCNDEFYPEIKFNAEDTERLSILQTDINAIVDSYRVTWITEGGVEDEWEDYLAELEDAGLEEYLAIKQAGYDRYMASISE